MSPQKNIEFVRKIIKVSKEKLKIVKKYGDGDSDYIQFMNNKIEALSDILKVYEEYWED